MSYNSLESMLEQSLQVISKKKAKLTIVSCKKSTKVIPNNLPAIHSKTWIWPNLVGAMICSTIQETLQ